jgi:hypothetical protein
MEAFHNREMDKLGLGEGIKEQEEADERKESVNYLSHFCFHCNRFICAHCYQNLSNERSIGHRLHINHMVINTGWFDARIYILYFTSR